MNDERDNHPQRRPEPVHAPAQSNQPPSGPPWRPPSNQNPGAGPGPGAGSGPPAPGRYIPWPPHPPGPRGQAGVGWLLIILGVLIMIGLPRLEKLLTPAAAAGTGDEVAIVLMEMQGKVMIGGVAIQQGESAMLYESAKKSLNIGSVAQRQRFAILAAEMAGPEEAHARLNEIDQLVDEAIAGDEAVNVSKVGELIIAENIITGPQASVQHVLHQIYAGDEGGWDAARNNIEALDDEQRELLRAELGWYGELALAPRATDAFYDFQADPPQRQSILNRARMIMLLVVGVFSALGFLGICGFIALIILFVFMFTRRIRTGFGPGRVHHGIYAETFGLWLFFFPLLQAGAGAAALFSPKLAMPAVLFMFFASLGALFWPVLRGARWEDVRADIGWTLGRNPLVQPVFGVVGYAMALPMLAVGIALTFVLIQVELFFTPLGEPLAPAGGPAHPILTQLGGPDLWPKIMILMLAAVAAPIVEETMFRGVLYRHLRDATHGAGFFLSVLFSGLINAFIFAVVHPQGWVTIPALMSLALAFSIIREWRGSILPAMLMHGISNFIVITLVISMLSI